MRILLVEDDPANVDLFVDVLEIAGHSVLVARTGPDGHARATHERFDLLILDIQLPGMRGDELCRKLRASGLHTPMLALSADALPHQVASSLEAGFNDYLTKPISPRALRDAVLRFATSARD